MCVIWNYIYFLKLELYEMFMENEQEKSPQVCLWTEFRSRIDLRYHAWHSIREEKGASISEGSEFLLKCLIFYSFLRTYNVLWFYSPTSFSIVTFPLPLNPFSSQCPWQIYYERKWHSLLQQPLAANTLLARDGAWWAPSPFMAEC